MVPPMRVAIGGVGHESNTFNPLYTGIEAFRIVEGEALLEDAAARFLVGEGVEVVPTIYARALPSGIVKREAYLQLKDELLRRLSDVGEVDGLCLFLHGAMEVEEIGDGESDLVKGVREVVGEEPLISVSLDLHGNIHPSLIETADMLTAYRTAPHVDTAETRVKAARLLLHSLKRRVRPVPVMVKPPVLLPGELVVTDVDPAASLYSSLNAIDRTPGILDSSLLVGMAWADSPQASASAIVIADGKRNEGKAYFKACKLAEAYWNSREEFHFEVEAGPIDEMIKLAKSSSQGPVFISDSGDNVTAGAPGDVPLIVERLLALGVEDAVVGGILDPEAVRLCRDAGVGNNLKVEVGGKIDRVNGYPLEVEGRVLKLTDDGAVLRAGGVDIILTSRRRGWTTLEAFRDFGIDPAERKIVVVKLGYLTPDFKRVAKLALLALSPGCTNQLIERLEYKRVRRPLYPLDKGFSWRPPEAH